MSAQLVRLSHILTLTPMAIASASGLAIWAAAHAQAPSPDLTVVELFTSQGCASCPPANDNVRVLADKPGVLVLSYSVTYWDPLGWKDTFAQPAFTARQYAYARALGHPAPFTPQVVIDGRADVVGAQRGEIEALASRTRLAGGPTLSIKSGRVELGAAKSPGAPADVWLVRYDPRTIQVPVRAGENAGRTLPHRNVVRSLIRLGGWTGGSESFDLPAAPAGLATAILVQGPRAGPMLSAAKG